MRDSIRMDWTPGSDFLRLLQARIARKALLYPGIDDRLEPFSEVWVGLHHEFMDGQILEGREFGRMLTIIDRRVSNYFRSQGARPIEQLSLSEFHPQDIETAKSAVDSPLEAALQQEQYRLIDEKLSELPPHWAEAVRSRYGYPGAPEWAELVKTSGTKRQNVDKYAKRGIEKLRSMFS
jgi:DNA-directed RNA polymerase specialized sigma24 family protein